MKILVVEDEPSIADNVLYSLDSEGFASTLVTTGGEAIRMTGIESFDLVVLDIGLPDISGFEVCRKIQAIKPVPVIFLTARNSEVDRIVGLEIGADDYLCKPFSPRELTARIRAVLRRCQPALNEGNPKGAALTNTGPLEVDQVRCQIRYHGQSLSLSKYEFRLLKTLAKYPGRVFSRAQLMEHASDEPDAAMERTVDAHIKSLRAKMKLISEVNDPIVTHRGLGYSLSENW